MSWPSWLWGAGWVWLKVSTTSILVPRWMMTMKPKTFLAGTRDRSHLPWWNGIMKVNYSASGVTITFRAPLRLLAFITTPTSCSSITAVAYCDSASPSLTRRFVYSAFDTFFFPASFSFPVTTTTKQKNLGALYRSISSGKQRGETFQGRKKNKVMSCWMLFKNDLVILNHDP